MQTSYTQKTERNLNLYKSNGSFEGFAEGTKIDETQEKVKTQEKTQDLNERSFFHMLENFLLSYAQKTCL